MNFVVTGARDTYDRTYSLYAIKINAVYMLFKNNSVSFYIMKISELIYYSWDTYSFNKYTDCTILTTVLGTSYQHRHSA